MPKTATRPPGRAPKRTAGKAPAKSPRKTADAQRAAEIVRRLRLLYPDAACELDHVEPFQLLIATILSAQTTDKAVNQATPGLFRAFPDAAALARATPAQVEPVIATIGLFRNKAMNVVASGTRPSVP